MATIDSSGESWSAYIRAATQRPGWSVARLAREAGLHRSTLFRWIKGGGDVTVQSVRRIAQALGDDPGVALRAAGDLLVDSQQERDEELEIILAADVDEEMRKDMIARLAELREQDKRRRMAELDFYLRRNVD